MDPSRPQPTEDPGLSRRTFLHAGTAAIALGAMEAPAWGDDRPESPARSDHDKSAEWRNRQPGMAYRRLGRTGLMISEVVCGGDPISLENYKHLELALEMGLNYLDMAPQYNRGDTERAYGRLLAGSPSRRDQVFLTTKVSDFNRVRTRLYKEIFDGLPGSQQEAIRKRARELREERGVEKPGYYLTYFPGQKNAFEPAYLRVAMMPLFSSAGLNGSLAVRSLVRFDRFRNSRAKEVRT